VSSTFHYVRSPSFKVGVESGTFSARPKEAVSGFRRAKDAVTLQTKPNCLFLPFSFNLIIFELCPFTTFKMDKLGRPR